MDVTVTLDSSVDLDDLHRLRDWLADQDELRGLVNLAEAPPRSGSLGGLTETLVVALGPGGVAGVFATALISWIRSRSSDVRVTVKRRDGSQFELSADRVRDLDAASLGKTIDQLGRDLATSPDDDGPLRDG